MSNYEYPAAGLPPAQPEVQAAVRRFRSLPIIQKQKRPLLYWLLGSPTPPYKMAPPDGAYVLPTPVPGQTCSNCRQAWQNVARGQFICAMIRGTIAPDAWCRFWES